MRAKILIIVVCVLTAGCAHQTAELVKPAASRAEVVFVQPEGFTDCKDESMDTGRAREHILAEIKATIEKLASHCVAEGQHLEIKITDIDLAGDFEPWRNANYSDIRYLRDIYPPRMELEFRLTGAEGKIIREGKRKLQQLGYMMSIVFPSSDPLRFDKELLHDWMTQEFKRSS